MKVQRYSRSASLAARRADAVAFAVRSVPARFGNGKL
jgi:hypothetical protein